MVGLQTLDLAIGVRVPASQPTVLRQTGPDSGLFSSQRSGQIRPEFHQQAPGRLLHMT